MQTHILLETDTAFNAKHLINFLKTLPHIKSVIVEPRKTPVRLSIADWVRPGRPAAEEEIEQMLDECEAEEGIPAKEARKQTLKELREWETKRKK